MTKNHTDNHGTRVMSREDGVTWVDFTSDTERTLRDHNLLTTMFGPRAVWTEELVDNTPLRLISIHIDPHREQMAMESSIRRIMSRLVEGNRWYIGTDKHFVTVGIEANNFEQIKARARAQMLPTPLR